MSVNIFNLPPEVLEEIFRHLPKANDRRRVAQVCRTFYRVVRGQSKKSSTLYLTKTVPNKSPVQVFKNSTPFPFSKLFVRLDALDINQDRDFWLEHGEHITELTMNGRFSFHWLTLFPYLKKLKIDQFSNLLIEENAPKIQLPVEELCFEYRFNMDLGMDEVCYILQRCPSLKSVELFMGPDHFKRYADLLPWIESIETVKMSVREDVELKDILELPSKVVLQSLKISSDTSVETISSLFNSPRNIETLRLNFNSLFTKDKILPLLKAESIKKLELSKIPAFAGSLDLLAQVPGLQEINFSAGRSMEIFPHYWSSPNTANKIHEIKFNGDLYPEVMTGLSSLSSLLIGPSNGNLEGVQNHPSLKKLVIRFNYGCGELEPISSLHDLEILELYLSPNTTTDSFKTFIRFPKLKKLFIDRVKMKNDFAMFLPENCPNLEVLSLKRISSVDKIDLLNDAGFENLIRALPYLKKIGITGSGSKSVSYNKVQQMKMKFPYLKINVRDL